MSIDDVWQYVLKEKQIFTFFSLMVSGMSLFIAGASFIYSRSNTRRFAQQEYIKKQVAVVTDMIQELNKKKIKVANTSYGSKSSSGSTDFHLLLFEFPSFALHAQGRALANQSIVFHGSCNQLLDIKKFIYNPLVPSSIVDKLIGLYAGPNHKVPTSTLIGANITVLYTGEFEHSQFDRPDPKNYLYVREPFGFAYESWDNLIAHIELLESSIIAFLKKHQVSELNLQKRDITT